MTESALNEIEKTYRKLVASGRQIIKLYSGNPNEQGFHFPPKILKEVYARYFEEQNYEPHPKGRLEARRAIADYYAKQGGKVNPENIILSSGTSESFFYLFSLLTQAGDNVLCPLPAYPLFNDIAQLRGIQLRHYSLKEEEGWAVDIEDLKNKTDARTRAILLISPNNPTGAVISSQEIEEITDWANQNQIALICDEVFSEFYFGQKPFPRPMVLARPQLCFTLNGISKMFALPGLKLGWIAVTGEKSRVDPAVDRLETTADTFLSCHIPIQQVLPFLFSEAQEFLKNYHQEVRRRRDIALDLLKQSPSLSVQEPKGGFYLTMALKNDIPLSEEEFVIQLLEKEGVFVHPGYFFDYEKGRHLIISYLTQEGKLREGLAAITKTANLLACLLLSLLFCHF